MAARHSVLTCSLEEAGPGSLGRSPRPLWVGVGLAHAPGVNCGLPPGPGSWQGSADAHGQQWPAPVLGTHVCPRQRRGCAHRHLMPACASSASGHWPCALAGEGAGCPGAAGTPPGAPPGGQGSALGTCAGYGDSVRRKAIARPVLQTLPRGPQLPRLSVGPQPPGCPPFGGQGDCGCLPRTSPRALTPCAQTRAERG